MCSDFPCVVIMVTFVYLHSISFVITTIITLLYVWSYGLILFWLVYGLSVKWIIIIISLLGWSVVTSGLSLGYLLDWGNQLTFMKYKDVKRSICRSLLFPYYFKSINNYVIISILYLYLTTSIDTYLPFLFYTYSSVILFVPFI